MTGTLTVWNVTPATKPTGVLVRLYKKSILPGQSAQIDAKWVHQYPKALQGAVAEGLVHLGEDLPAWYYTNPEDDMKRLKHTGPVPVTLASETFSPTVMEPGQETVVSDEAAESMAEDLKAGGIVVEDVPEEKSEEKPDDKPKKRRIKRGATNKKKEE